VSLGERVLAIEPRGDAFVVRTLRARPGAPDAEGVRRARHVVVATGYYDTPRRIGVPGEDLPHVSHYFDEPHPYHGRCVVVVGGSNSAAEAALLLFRAGARVTLVHRRAKLSGSIKYWVRPDIENRIAEKSIAARLESRVLEIGPDSVCIEGPAGAESLPAAAVFLLTGYRPDVSLLESAGVRVDAATLRPEHDPVTLETNVPRLYLAGAIVSGADSNRVFIENGRFHGAAVVKAILDRAAGRD
jgi:thioredoxin reductase (NADPH)